MPVARNNSHNNVLPLRGDVQITYESYLAVVISDPSGHRTLVYRAMRYIETFAGS